jgi:hypothetical protein
MSEIDLSRAQVDGAAQIINHFTKDLDSLAKDYTVPCEEWCAELYDVQAQIKKLQDREAKLKEVAKAKKDRGTFLHGGYALKITERAGSRTLDKELLIGRIEAELGADEAKVYLDAATKIGKPSVVISIEKINASGVLSGDGSVREGGL